MNTQKEHIGFLSARFELSQIWTQENNPGGLPYETDEDARRKFWIRPLKETNLDVAQAFRGPNRNTPKKNIKKI